MTSTKVDVKRLDRQIRLWGLHGQECIQGSLIYVLGSGIDACEFMKVMALHGTMELIIVDNAVVNSQDISSNFFCPPASLGSIRAETVARTINELNPDMKISVVNVAPDNLPDMENLPPGSVIASFGNWPEETLTRINDFCRGHRFRQVHVQTTGFFGAVYLDGGIHAIEQLDLAGVEHPAELRIRNPWPELQQFFDSFDLSTLSDLDFAGIPFPIFLYKAYRIFCDENGRAPQLNQADKGAVQKIIGHFDREELKPTGVRGPMQPAGLLQALGSLTHICGAVPQVPSKLGQVLKLVDGGLESGDLFWRVLASVREFVQKHGCAPHYGDCPDMEGDPALFRTLRGVYRAKSERDWEEVLSAIDPAERTANADFLNRMRQNIWRVGGVIYSPLTVSLSRVTAEKGVPDKYVGLVGALFHAARLFKTAHSADPKSQDVEAMKHLVSQAYGPDDELEKMVIEFCRFEGEQLPSVATTISGVAAEEVSKLIIHQAEPAGGPIAYDAVHEILRQY